MNLHEVPFFRIFIIYTLAVLAVSEYRFISFEFHLSLIITFNFLLYLTVSHHWKGFFLMSTLFFVSILSVLQYSNNTSLLGCYPIERSTKHMAIVDRQLHFGQGQYIAQLQCDELRHDHKILVKLAEPSILIGDTLLFSGHLKAISGPLNPFQFDFKAYMNQLGVTHQVFIREVGEVKANSSFHFRNFALDVRNKFLAILKKHLSNDDSFGVAAAMVLGTKETLGKEIQEQFKLTGTMHVLTVSGLHVGIVSMILLFIFSWLKEDKWILRCIKYIVVLLGIWFFALITGLAPAVVRSSTMLSLVFVSKLLWRRSNVYNVIFASGFFMLVYNPNLLFNLSFQFSYSALLSIVFFFPMISTWFSFSNQWLNRIWDLIALSLAAQILVFPLMVIYFGQFPIYFWLGGIIAVPAATVILCLSLGLIFTELLLPNISLYIGYLLSDLVHVFNWSMERIATLPSASINGLFLDHVSIAILYTSLLVLMLQFNQGYKKKTLCFIFCMCCLFLYQNIKMSQLEAQSRLNIYASWKGDYIDFFNGNSSYVLYNDLDSVNVQSLTSKYYQSRGIREVYQKDALDLKGFNSLPTINSLSQFNGQQEIDLLLINRAFIETDRALLKMVKKKIILSARLKWGERNTWHKQLNKKQAEMIHDLHQDGIFILDLKNG